MVRSGYYSLRDRERTSRLSPGNIHFYSQYIACAKHIGTYQFTAGKLDFAQIVRCKEYILVIFHLNSDFSRFHFGCSTFRSSRHQYRCIHCRDIMIDISIAGGKSKSCYQRKHPFYIQFLHLNYDFISFLIRASIVTFFKPQFINLQSLFL